MILVAVTVTNTTASTNRQLMPPFVDGNESDRGDGYGEYVSKMAQPGEWGDNISLEALCCGVGGYHHHHHLRHLRRRRHCHHSRHCHFRPYRHRVHRRHGHITVTLRPAASFPSPF